MFNSGTATLINCTVSDNSGEGAYRGTGGGVFNSGTATLTNCTVSDNDAGGNDIGDGGGVSNSGMATLTNCTVSGNDVAGNIGAGSGGGVFNSGTATLNNTIVASQFAGGDIAGTIAGSHNLIGDGSGGLADSIAGDPMLAPLADNGGPTQTMALLPGSPAIDHGSGTDPDQRGIAVVNGVRDIGAFENRDFTLTYVSGSNSERPDQRRVQPRWSCRSPASSASRSPAAWSPSPPRSGASTTSAVTPAVIDASGQASLTAGANGSRRGVHGDHGGQRRDGHRRVPS